MPAWSQIEGLLTAVGTQVGLGAAVVNLDPTRAGILSLAMAGAVASGVHLWRIARAEDRQTRLRAVVAGHIVERPVAESGRMGWPQRLGAMIASTPAVGTKAQRSHLEALAAAGYRGPAALVSFLALKLASCLGFALLLWVAFDWVPLLVSKLLVLRWPCLVVGLLGGWIVPDAIVARLAAGRRRRIERAIPDALDLMVICAQSGLSLSQAIEEISRDLRNLAPELADELEVTAAEMRVLTERGAALENLGKRTRIANLRGLIATLNQSIKFGTPLSEALRVFSGEMRTARIARMEERAARLPVLLAMPLIGMIMPALLILIGTPVGLRIIDSMRSAFPQLF